MIPRVLGLAVVVAFPLPCLIAAAFAYSLELQRLAYADDWERMYETPLRHERQDAEDAA